MSRKGCSPDNAACEGFFGRLKTELFYPVIGRTSVLTNSSRLLTPTSAGTTKNASKYPLAHSVPLNTGRALESQHKPVQVLRRTHAGSVCTRNQHPMRGSIAEAPICASCRSGETTREPLLSRSTIAFRLSADITSSLAQYPRQTAEESHGHTVD